MSDTKQVIQKMLGLRPFVLLELTERGTLDVTFGGGITAEDVPGFIEVAYDSSRATQGDQEP